MNKKEKRARILAINEEMRGMLDKVEQEKKEMSPEDRAHFDAIRNERAVLVAELERENIREYEARVSAASDERERNLVFAERVIEAVRNKIDIDIPLVRATQDTASAQNLVPLTIGEIIEPLEKGLILDKVGTKMQYGLEGDWQFPVVAAVEATIENENAEVGDKTITISAVKPTPRRCAITIPVSNRALYQTNEKLREIVLTQMNMAITRLLNKWAFQATEVSSGVQGPFVAPGTSKTYTTSPTFKDIIGLKGAVDKTGIVDDGTGCYVMSSTMKATLESTPREAGDARMILENGNINGVPVFVTQYMLDTDIYFGYFGYLLVGQFGPVNMVVDPYTGATKNITRFTLNIDFDQKAARPEAFGKLSSGA